EVIAAARDLCSCRRAAAALALAATRQATPCSQGPNDCSTRSEPALRAKTRKVAWEASWAARWLRTRARQTVCTIGPCRRTKVANAASAAGPCHARNRSTSSASLSPPTVPTLKARSSGRRIVLCCPGIANPLSSRAIFHPADLLLQGVMPCGDLIVPEGLE